jgi:hypothetical protein
MIFSIYNNIDATIYEKSVELNTGLDPVLEINKTLTDGIPHNSRVLLKFDLSKLTSNYATALLTQTASYYLRLTTTEPSEIPLDYTIYAYPVSQSWSMGTGRYSALPTGSNGVSWKYRLGSDVPSSAWATSSFATTSTGSWVTNPGGSTWLTSSAHSQSFSYETSDILMDVTSTVRAWISGTIANNGFVLKKSDADEASTSVFGSLKFFSKDTSTIYGPRLEMRYRDVIYHTSNSIISYTDEVVVRLNNLREAYSETDKVRFNIGARPKYPTRTFATSSNYLTNYQLISSSLYSIRDAHTNDVIIPFDDAYTAISADSNGSYFKLNLDGLAPERYYRLLIKSKIDSTEEYIFDNNWIFKVVR